MIHRRAFLGGLTAAAMAESPAAAGLPRKVIVGTAMQPFWVKHPGLTRRLEELTGLVDRMAEMAKRTHGRHLDLAVLPETSISGEAGGDAFEVAVGYDGPVADAFARTAQKHGCYIVAASYFREPGTGRRCSNAAVLIDRQGARVGTYRKVHLVVAADGKTMEGGSEPGREFPVFDCDFGKLGLQICYDMEFDPGWRALAAKGAELIAWPTQSPQTAQPAARAAANRAWIVSSTWRHNASLFEPTGKIAAQIKPPDSILVHELDLSYLILPWSPKLKNGKALEQIYGSRIGYRYYEDEDLGLFWSNDPKTPIREMAAALGLRQTHEELDRVREAYRKAGLPGH